MDITLLGYVILPLSVLLFFYNPKKLYELTIFSIPFTGSAVFLSSAFSETAQPIRFSVFMISLCLLRHFISVLYAKKIKIIFSVRTPLTLIFILGFICILPTVLSFLLGKTIETQKEEYEKFIDQYTIELIVPVLYYQYQNLIQTVYFLMGCLFTYYCVVKNNTLSKIARSIEVYINASFFVVIWGSVQLIYFFMDSDFPSLLFNHDTSNHVQGIFYQSHLAALHGVLRIHSVALEPSIMAQQLVTVLPLLFFDKKRKSSFRKIVLFFVIIILMLSTSTTAYVGIMIFGFFILLSENRTRINKYVLLLLLPFVIIFFLFQIEAIQYKMSTFSGLVRLDSVIHAFHHFLNHPILGIGWGVVPIWDLIICILSSLGIPGLTVFVFLLIVVYTKINKITSNHTEYTFFQSIKYSLISLLLVSQISGFIYYSHYFWFIMGLAIAAAGLCNLQEEEKKLRHDIPKINMAS